MSVIPMVQLEELMATRLGSVDPSKFVDETFELYSIPAFDSRKPEVVTGAEIGSTKQIVQPRDVLLSKIVPHIRRSWIVGPVGEHRQIASGEWIVFRSEDAAPEYLRHVLLSDDFHAQFMQTVSGVGGSLLRARPAQVAKIRIPLPPFPEQRRIAAILDKADALRTKRREALAQLDRLAQSIFVEMFGDPAANPKGWPNRAMSTLFEASPIFGTMIPPSADGGEWLSLRVANIQDWRLDLTDQKFVTLPTNMVERHSVRDNDLLLARAIASQEHLGKAVVVRPAGRQWAFDSHLMRLRFDHTQALPEFIRHLWMTTGGRTLFLKATRRSAVQFNINTKEMNALELPIPPIQLQRQFIDRIEALNLVRHKQELALAEFVCLFTALQHRAFRGEL